MMFLNPFRRNRMLKMNERGLQLVRDFEGLRLDAYLDAVGVPTIGYGHTGGVRMGSKITIAEADRLLRKDIKRFEAAVKMLIGDAPTTSDQFSALVSFAFNLGAGALKRSTLLRLHLAGDIKGAAEQFGRWVYAKVGGRSIKLNGLIRRRAAEARLYRGEM